jgi:hypothetical protein
MNKNYIPFLGLAVNSEMWNVDEVLKHDPKWYQKYMTKKHTAKRKKNKSKRGK